jgi:hypothetical protein
MKYVGQINALKYTTSIKLSKTACKDKYGTLQYDYYEKNVSKLKCVSDKSEGWNNDLL